MDARDDLIVNDQYSLDAHHDEETGKKIRKKIWKVTIILSIITILEVGFGIIFPKTDFVLGTAVWDSVRAGYIILTLVKAAYIVLVFMHLGDEQRNLRITILAPYILFMAYLLFIALTEGMYINVVLENYL